jgi:WD40 repeat protein
MIWLLIIALLMLSCDSVSTEEHSTLHKLQRVFQRQMSLKNAEFSVDGKYFLVEDGLRISVWQVKDFTLYRKFELINDKDKDKISEPKYIVGAHFTPDSKSVFVGFKNGKAMMIDLNSGIKSIIDFGTRETDPEIVEISKSGKILVLGARYMDVDHGKRIAHDYGSPKYQTHISITTDDKYILSQVGNHSDSLSITETATGNVTRVYLASFFLFNHPKVDGFLLLPDNDTIAVYLETGSNRLYSIRQAKEIGAFSRWTVGFFQDCKTMLTSYDGRSVTLWDFASKKKKKTLKLKWESCITWLSGTNWFASLGEPSELVIQSAESGEIICKGKISESYSRYREGYHYIDYLPTERLLMLGNAKKGYIDVYKLQ